MADLTPRLGRSPGEGNEYALQNSRLENSMDRGGWWAQSMGSQRVRQDWVTELNWIFKWSNDQSHIDGMKGKPASWLVMCFSLQPKLFPRTVHQVQRSQGYFCLNGTLCIQIFLFKTISILVFKRFYWGTCSGSGFTAFFYLRIFKNNFKWVCAI